MFTVASFPFFTKRHREIEVRERETESKLIDTQNKEKGKRKETFKSHGKKIERMNR